MIRKILGIIAGYAIFVITSLLLFKLSGQAPHAEATTGFMIFTAVYGLVFSLIAGFVTQFIAKANDLSVNYILFVIMAGFAIFSFIKAEGSHWTQLMAIFIFAPASVLGGWFCRKRYSK